MQYVAPYPTGNHPVNNYNFSQEPSREPQSQHSYQQNYHPQPQNLAESLPPQNLTQNISCKPDPAVYEQHTNYEQQNNYSSPPPQSYEHPAPQSSNFVQPSTPSQGGPESVSIVYGEPPNYAQQEPVQSPAPSMEPPTPQIPPPVETQYSDSDSGSDYDPEPDRVPKVKVELKKEIEVEEADDDDDEALLEPSDDDSDSDYGSKKAKARKRKRAPPKPRTTRQSSSNNTPSRSTRSSKGKKAPPKREKSEELDIGEAEIKEVPPVTAPVIKKESNVNELSNQVQVLFLPSEGDAPNVAMLKKRLLELSETDIEKTKKLKLLQNLTWRQKKEIQKLKDEIKKIKGRE